MMSFIIFLHLTEYLVSDKKQLKRTEQHAARMGERKYGYKMLIGNPEGKRSTGRPRHR
jgi:hypothetical protein